MSLWTPGGEHPVGGGDDEPGDQQAPPTVPGAPDLDQLSLEERAQAEELARQMAETQRQLAETPAAVVVANHVMGFYELAAIHLSQQPPALDEARIAVDAMAAVVTVLEGRLGEVEPTLKDALSQIQMAWVTLQERAAEGAAAAGDPAGEGDGQAGAQPEEG